MDTMQGQTIRGYHFHERIGSGGFGTVYRATQLSVERDVAIKIIEPINTDFMRRLELEARLIARLEGFHIITLIDYFTNEEGRAFLVMRLLKGGSLRERIRRGPLPLPLVNRHVSQLAQALTVAHAKGVIHRDLKPDNILLDEEQNAFLGDFGIAKELNTTFDSNTSGNLGTPLYAAPEQLEKLRITPATDIYSLALTICECLAGKYPFSEVNPFKRIGQPLPSLHVQRTDIPREVDKVLQKASARAATDRYTSAAEFAEAFQKAVALASIPPTQLGEETLELSAKELVDSGAITYVPTTRPRQDFVFLSHSHKDDASANQILEALTVAGVDGWADHVYLEPGDEWDDEVQKHLNNCRDGLAILSRSSAASQECQAEWRTILGLKKHLYVALVEDIPQDEFPYRLRTIQYVDLRQDFMGGVATLIEDMLETRKGKRLPPEDRTTQLPAVQPAILIETQSDIPHRSPKLIGRDGLLETIDYQMTERGRVVLQGMGGIGKTALAAEYVARTLPKGRVVWLEATSRNVTELLEALVQPFDVRASLLDTQGRLQANAIRRLLTDELIQLVVLDDVWDSTVLERLIDSLPNKLPVLITSRQRYSIGVIVNVGELAMADGLELLGFHANQFFPKDDAQAIKLCMWLGFHPLALEIAGKTLQVDELTPTELLERLEKESGLPRPPDKTSRSIQEVLESSVNNLDAGLQSLFLTFGALFVPEATPQLLSKCVGRDVEKELMVLARHGLAKRLRRPKQDTPYYHLHDLAYIYARERSPVSQTTIVQACREYALEQVGSAPRLDAERLNLLKAAAAAYRHGDPDTLITILRIFTVDNRAYLGQFGHDGELLRQLELAVNAARCLGRMEEVHYLLGKLGNIYYQRGDLQGAIQAYEEAGESAHILGWADRSILALCVASRVRSDMGQIEAAEAGFERAYVLALDSQDGHSIARVLENKAVHAYNHANYEITLKLSKQEAEIAQGLPDDERLYYALLNWGAAETKLGRPAASLEPFGRALTLARDADDLIKLAGAQHGIAEALLALKNCEGAKAAALQALDLFQKGGYTAKIAEIEALLAEIEACK